MLGCANIDEILDSILRIHPVAGLNLTTAAKAEQNGVCDVALGEAKFKGAGTVDGVMEPRQIRGLLNTHINGPIDAPNPIGEPSSDFAIVGEVASNDLDVERSGQTEIKRLAD